MPILSFSDLQIRCAEENKSIYEVAQEEEASLLGEVVDVVSCLLYTSPSPRDA